MPKKIWGILVAVIVVLCLGGWSVTHLVFQAKVKKEISSFNLKNVNTSYKGDVHVNYSKKEATGTWKVAAINDTGKDQSYIYFNLYPNHYKDLSKLKGDVWKEVLGPSPKPGEIKISQVTVNHKKVKASVNGMILKIPVQSQWKKNQTVLLKMDFDLKVPHDLSTLTYDDHSILFGNWLPTRVVYNKGKGWVIHKFYALGDSFYTGVANYQMKVSIPKGYQLASSGYDTDGVLKGNQRVYKIQGNQMRDFAMVVMDQTYTPLVTKSNGVTFRTWHYKTDPVNNYAELHTYGVDSLNYYSSLWGAYPYKQYDMIRTGGFFGGMEYPGLVYIQGKAYTDKSTYAGLTDVAHETAHQWWYGMVGDDEVQNPWLDESLANYSTIRFALKEDPKLGETFLKSLKDYAKAAVEYENFNIFVSSPLSKFLGDRDYYVLIYAKGPVMYDDLTHEIGEEKMDLILRNLLTDYKFKIATPQDYLNEFKKVLGPESDHYFNTWLHHGTTKFKP